MPIRLVLAEDQYLVREGLRRLLEAQDELEVAAVCDDLESLFAAVDAERPDVVVTDIRMPPDSSDEDPGCRATARTHPEVGVVVLSQYATPSYVLALLENGSEGRAYLLKERVKDLDQLLGAIHAVAEGGSVMDPKVVEALVAENARSDDSPLNELTPERDVLREMAEEEQCRDRRSALPDSEVGREIILDLPQARAHVGDGSPQAREGRDPLPGGKRLGLSARRERAGEPNAVAGLRSDRQPGHQRLDPVAQPLDPASELVSATISKLRAPSPSRTEIVAQGSLWWRSSVSRSQHR